MTWMKYMFSWRCHALLLRVLFHLYFISSAVNSNVTARILPQTSLPPLYLTCFRTTLMRWWGCATTGWRECSTSASSPPWQPVPSLSCCVPFPGRGDKWPAGEFVLCMPAWALSFPPAANSLQLFVLYEPTENTVASLKCCTDVFLQKQFQLFEKRPSKYLTSNLFQAL